MHQVHYFIALGSNLGNRLAHIEKSLTHIAKLGRLVNTSHLYETQPANTRRSRLRPGTRRVPLSNDCSSDPSRPLVEFKVPSAVPSSFCTSPASTSPLSQTESAFPRTSDTGGFLSDGDKNLSDNPPAEHADRSVEFPRPRFSEDPEIAEHGPYLNACCELIVQLDARSAETVEESTRRQAQTILKRLLGIEKKMGRVRTGVLAPRTIDLDILCIVTEGGVSVPINAKASRDLPRLILPHPGLSQRRFVLEPLADLQPGLKPLPQEPELTVKDLLWEVEQLWLSDPSDSLLAPTQRLWAFGGSLWENPAQETTPRFLVVMNATPDSFADDKPFLSSGEIRPSEDRLEQAIARLRDEVEAGAAAIDVGAKSTRPGFTEITALTEYERLEDLLLRASDALSDTPLSCDTQSLEVFIKARKVRPEIALNDTSGLFMDPEVLKLLKRRVPTMIVTCPRQADDTGTETPEGGVQRVAAYLNDTTKFLLSEGIPRWRLAVDPGFGFSIKGETSVLLLTEISSFKLKLHHDVPLCLGWSRKKFLSLIHPEQIFNRYATGGRAHKNDAAGNCDLLSLKRLDAVGSAVLQWLVAECELGLILIRVHSVHPYVSQ